jgi:adenosylcobinamide-GDP ribazoletransferase
MADIQTASLQWLRDRAADLLVCLRFCTLVPIPTFSFEKPAEEASLSAAANMLPVAGAIIGAVAAILLCIFVKLGLPASLAALLAVAALIVLTGAMHEDGLADFSDALGGATPEQRLAIMKDSRIGSFGSLALVIFVFGRVISIAMLAEHSLGLASAVLISAAASSRAFALIPLHLLAPARADGLGAASGGAKQSDLAVAGIAILIFSLIPLFAGAGLGRVILALIVSAAAAYGVTLLARKLLNGQTGDVAGATQQCAELASYLVFTTHL